jgi:hypothetical protein
MAGCTKKNIHNHAEFAQQTENLNTLKQVVSSVPITPKTASKPWHKARDVA